MLYSKVNPQFSARFARRGTQNAQISPIHLGGVSKFFAHGPIHLGSKILVHEPIRGGGGIQRGGIIFNSLVTLLKYCGDFH